MERRRHIEDHYAVTLEPQLQGYGWTVVCGDGRVVSGHAPSSDSARRSGAFVGAAVSALDQIGRRRF
ncbi:MAG: hypothetical protein JO303_02710 [Caulobacteraceae bacterium]|nr:hypothetical protein [Caulobacteraceae bacterium]